MSMSREICKACFHVNAVGFEVSSEIWAEAVPADLWGNVICLSCFVRMADEKLLPWDDEIKFYPVSLKTHLDPDE